MRFKGDAWAIPEAAAGVFQNVDKRGELFSCLVPAEEAYPWSPFQQNTSMKVVKLKRKLVEAFLR